VRNLTHKAEGVYPVLPFYLALQEELPLLSVFLLTRDAVSAYRDKRDAKASLPVQPKSIRNLPIAMRVVTSSTLFWRNSDGLSCSSHTAIAIWPRKAA